MKPFFTTLTIFVATTALSATERAQNTIILDNQGVRNLGIETVEADYQNFEETVFAIGRIVEISANRSVLSTRVAGRIVELDAFEGDTVEAGQRIAVIESRQLGDPPPTVELFAPQAGLVVASHVRLGQPVEPSAELMDIADRSTVWAVAQIPEQEAALVSLGTRAYIRVPALGDDLLEASVSRFGVEADPQSGTIAAIFSLSNPEDRLKPGMRAEFSVVLRWRTDVLAIPREAVQGDPARRVVFVKDFEIPNAFIRLPVVLGEQNERFVEVVEGLFPGDEVVTRGSYGLSFAGGGSGLSLKEALDAAHGHAHAEDGSELPDVEDTEGGYTHKEGEEHGAHDGDSTPHISMVLLIYTVVVTLALILAVQQIWNRRRVASKDADRQHELNKGANDA